MEQVLSEWLWGLLRCVRLWCCCAFTGGKTSRALHMPLLRRPMFYSSCVTPGAPPSFPRALESSWKELGGKAEQQASLKAFVQASMSAEVHPYPCEAFW